MRAASSLNCCSALVDYYDGGVGVEECGEKVGRCEIETELRCCGAVADHLVYLIRGVTDAGEGDTECYRFSGINR